MWKSRPEEKPAPVNPPLQPTLTPASAPLPGLGQQSRPPAPAKAPETFRGEVAAHIGKSVLIKGQLSGSEDLYLDGEVEGSIELHDHTLVVGPNGRVRANISAREVVVHGKVDGNITSSERVELKKSCILAGDITTRRIVIEDGAYFKGSVDLGREAKNEVPKMSALAAGANAAPVAVLTPQASFLEHS